ATARPWCSKCRAPSVTSGSTATVLSLPATFWSIPGVSSPSPTLSSCMAMAASPARPPASLTVGMPSARRTAGTRPSSPRAGSQMEPGSEWQKMKPRDRAKVMWRLADMLSARAEEIGRIETLANGKPIFESQFVDMPAAAECLYYFAGWSGKVVGDTIPVQENAFAYTLREPVGVVGAITPWNFPLMLAVWKIARALACGNTVVIKPSAHTALSLLKFAEYAKECGLPAGVLNVVPGRGSVV